MITRKMQLLPRAWASWGFRSRGAQRKRIISAPLSIEPTMIDNIRSRGSLTETTRCWSCDNSGILNLRTLSPHDATDVESDLDCFEFLISRHIELAQRTGTEHAGESHVISWGNGVIGCKCANADGYLHRDNCNIAPNSPPVQYLAGAPFMLLASSSRRQLPYKHGLYQVSASFEQLMPKNFISSGPLLGGLRG